MRRYERWFVSSDALGSQSYTAQRVVDGVVETVYLHSHCLACAKIDVLAEKGGAVDTRGWHLQGLCGALLKASASID